MSKDYTIEIKDEHKTFDSKEVHNGVTLSVERGENITILGGSGSGKSVLVKEIIGIIKPDSGEILIDGEDIVPMNDSQLLEVRKKMGMLFQGSALFDSLTVGENIAYPLVEHCECPESEIEGVVAKNLELVGLKGIEDKMPHDLSGGMQKRVALARAIAMDPEILLYDEPTTGLDPPNTNRINEIIKDLKEKICATGVIITHDVASAFEISDRIAFFCNGKIVFTGSVEEAQHTDIKELDDFIHGRLVEEEENRLGA